MVFCSAIRSPRPRRCCTTLARLKDYDVTTFQAEDEIAAICAAIGASYSPAIPRRHLELGSGHRAQDRGARPGDRRRAAPGRRQRPARRAVDRPADQDRAVGPLSGGVRPQRRQPDLRCWRRARRATALRGRDRGGPAGDQVHDPGDLADRRLHRQRCRALGAFPTWTSVEAFPVRVQRTDPDDFLPYERDPKPRLARATGSGSGHAGARAPHRRYRERRRQDRQHLLRPGEPPAHDLDTRAEPRSTGIVGDIPDQHGRAQAP